MSVGKSVNCVVDRQRVKGVFTEKMELQEFPFDIQVSREFLGQ